MKDTHLDCSLFYTGEQAVIKVLNILKRQKAVRVMARLWHAMLSRQKVTWRKIELSCLKDPDPEVPCASTVSAWHMYRIRGKTVCIM